ncbi:hypothetical protein HPB48_005454 [Haemaphysalis longicornis]|uniref:Uncharacterized protein n=1 Tax=Haemaphysalis longicornis TaxID=44386 RepID=A0A9J6GL71_HAELO|nr:hypothetical protein HPB48_005454 [Haemaphysalis longicornis]
MKDIKLGQDPKNSDIAMLPPFSVGQRTTFSNCHHSIVSCQTRPYLLNLETSCSSKERVHVEFGRQESAKTRPGRDGIVRACKVRIPNGQFLTRPVQKLYPLELAKTPGEDVIEVEDDEVRVAQ